MDNIIGTIRQDKWKDIYMITSVKGEHPKWGMIMNGKMLIDGKVRKITMLYSEAIKHPLVPNVDKSMFKGPTTRK